MTLTLCAAAATGAATTLTTFTAAAAPSFSSYVVAGSQNRTDSTGRVWTAAPGNFVGAKWSSSTVNVVNTTDDAIYQQEAYGMSAYSQPVPYPGRYKVTVHLAELYFTKPGERVFSVDAEGQRKMSSVDIVEDAGVNTAYRRSFTVPVVDGRLDLGFVNEVNYARVAGIQVDYVDATTSAAPPANSTPTPTASTAPTATPTPAATAAPAGYVGRSATPAGWKVAFQDDFATLAPQGSFLSTYGATWNAYDEGSRVTDRIGFYDPKRISVVDAGPDRVLQCQMVPPRWTGKGLPSGCAPVPKFGQSTRADGYGMTSTEKIEMRVRIAKPANGYHIANLGWPASGSWPLEGEDDFYEFDPVTNATVGGYLHPYAATSGNDQTLYTSSAPASQWHVVGRERIAGQSYRWFVDGKQLGETVTSRVPKDLFVWILQSETVGTAQTTDCLIQWDWVTIWTPA